MENNIKIGEFLTLFEKDTHLGAIGCSYSTPKKSNIGLEDINVNVNLTELHISFRSLTWMMENVTIHSAY